MKILNRTSFRKIKELYIDNFLSLAESYFLKTPKYISQFHGDEFWDKRACGMACINMLIKSDKTLQELIQIGLELDGYIFDGDIGWYHHSLVQVANKHGRKSYSKRCMPANEVLHNIAQNKYVTASIKSNTGGHLVLIYGYDEQNIYYHDPYHGKSREMSFNNFKKIFNNKAIITKV